MTDQLRQNVKNWLLVATIPEIREEINLSERECQKERKRYCVEVLNKRVLEEICMLFHNQHTEQGSRINYDNIKQILKDAGYLIVSDGNKFKSAL